MGQELIAFILGILEGLTEFLPVSSTGHLILAAHLMDFTGEKAKTFEVVIQLGAILAITILYRRRLISLFNFKGAKERFNLLHVFLGIIPAGIGGVIFHDFIKEHLFSPSTVVYGLVFGAFLLIYAEKKKTVVTATSLDELSYKQSLSIGLFQLLALYPGFSRAGSTISGGLLTGADRKTAADFSFLVALPVMIGATGLDLLKNYQYITTADLPMFAIGFVTSFVVATIAVVTFLKILDKVKLTYFAYYRIILAIIFAYFFLF